MSRCSIVIPVYNQAGLTKQCLDALLRTVGPDQEVEIIVVDNASQDDTARLVASYGKRVRSLRHESNLGFAHACNHGAGLAEGDSIVFLNNDTIPMPGWLDALMNYAATHPAAGAIGSKLLFPNDTIQHAGMVLTAHRQPRHLYLGFPTDHPAVNKSRQFQMVSGACLFLTRKAFIKAGGFDPAFLNGYEDVDLCLRLGLLDYEVHYCHTSVLYHLEGRSEGRFHQETQNEQTFKRRWSAKVRPDEWVYLIEDGMIEVIYHPGGWLDFRIAAELGGSHSGSDVIATANLLNQRAKQVHRLLMQNAALRTRLANLLLTSSAGGSQREEANRWKQVESVLRRGPREWGEAATLPFGVNLLGYFQSEKGVGAALRSTRSSLEATQVPLAFNNFQDEGSNNRTASTLAYSTNNPFAINLIHLNADRVPMVARQMPEYLQNRVNVGYWNWELTWFPPEWEESFAYLDEVWVPSMFTYDSVRAVSPIPVQMIPFAVSVPESPATRADRDRWNLPEKSFTFLFAFDFHSYFARKNPLAVLEAFKRAFGKNRDVLLVLKTVHAEDGPLELAEIHKACQDMPNIRLLNDTLTHDEVYSLMRSCDAYAALHRSEGFGLMLAEAMAMGKPVIATNYSSNVDFMTPANSLPVRYRLVEIEKNHGPYRQGASWAEPDIDHAAEMMRLLAADPELGRYLGAQARQDIAEQFNYARVGKLLQTRLSALTAAARGPAAFSGRSINLAKGAAA